MTATTSKYGFGRDLPSILGSSSRTEEKNEGIQTGVLLIPLEKISSGELQPRKDFAQSAIQELANSIKEQGIIQPILVREISKNKYELIAGERRWRAAHLAGLTAIPSIIHNIDQKAAVAMSIIENIQRENLSPIEEAIAYRRLKEEFKMTQEEVAKKVGKGRSTITNSLRLLNLHTDVQKMVGEKLLEIGHAKLLLTLDEDTQINLAKIIHEKNLSVRAAEELLSKMKNAAQKNDKVKLKSTDVRIKNWQGLLSNKLHTKVIIDMNEQGKGRVVIYLESSDEIEWLVKKLS